MHLLCKAFKLQLDCHRKHRLVCRAFKLQQSVQCLNQCNASFLVLPPPPPQTCNKWEPLVQVDATLIISKANLKNKDARFNKTSCPYEGTIEATSTIERVDDDPSLGVQYRFKTIAEIADVQAVRQGKGAFDLRRALACVWVQPFQAAA